MSDMRREQAQGEPATREQRVAERLLVLALLRRDHVERWSRAELEDELAGIPAHVTASALRGVTSRGMAALERSGAWAAEPTRALDELDMICI
jgi:hypothetical protein